MRFRAAHFRFIALYRKQCLRILGLQKYKFKWVWYATVEYFIAQR